MAASATASTAAAVPPFFAPAFFLVAIDQLSGSEGIAFNCENTCPSGHKLRASDGDAIGGGEVFPSGRGGVQVVKPQVVRRQRATEAR